MNQLKSKRSRDLRSSVVPNRSQDVEEKPSGGSRRRTEKAAQRYLETGARGVQRAHQERISEFEFSDPFLIETQLGPV